MTTITISLNRETEARLRQAAEELGRDVWDLATCAVEEAALDFFRGRPIDADPGHAARSIATVEGASI